MIQKIYIQIGSLGPYVKAIRRFLISHSKLNCLAYAVPYILGEIKRFFRDDGQLKVSRSLKDLHV